MQKCITNRRRDENDNTTMKDQTVRGSSMLKITDGNAISICINDGISTVQCTIHAPCHEYDFYDRY